MRLGKSSDCARSARGSAARFSFLNRFSRARAARAAEGARLPRPLHTEPLEPRVLLAAAPPDVIAQFSGALGAGASDTIPVSVQTADFTLAGGETLLGFHLKAADG